jgi:bifunctional DNase/RNase
MEGSGTTLVEVKVGGLAIDDKTKQPVVILKEVGGARILPIWIGPAEAGAIASELSKKKPERPQSHDLMATLVSGLKSRLARVAIVDLRDNTFFASLYLERGGERIVIDARPSDSIALALRTQSPIFVAERILSGEGATRPREKSEEERAEELRRYLEDLDPEDFGKFTM